MNEKLRKYYDQVKIFYPAANYYDSTTILNHSTTKEGTLINSKHMEVSSFLLFSPTIILIFNE
jgi:hypothetical protein